MAKQYNLATNFSQILGVALTMTNLKCSRYFLLPCLPGFFYGCDCYAPRAQVDLLERRLDWGIESE